MKTTTSSLGLAGLHILPTPPPAPELKPRAADLSPEIARRLLLNQLLVSMLESNTTALLDKGVWPDRENKLMHALGHRVGELFDRYYERNNAFEIDWLNPINSLSEGAIISILALAVEGNNIKTHRLGELLTQLAQLAGTYQDDSTSNAA